MERGCEEKVQKGYGRGQWRDLVRSWRCLVKRFSGKGFWRESWSKEVMEGVDGEIWRGRAGVWWTGIME